MGYAISWAAVRERDADRFLQTLGLSPTGASEEIPESLICTARLDTGWRVIWYNEYTCPFLGTGDLAALSMDCEVLLCRVEEHLMASSSELWSEGQRQWCLSHEGENGPKGLSVAGGVPESFAAIQKEMEDRQRAEGGDEAGVDYIFEIPLKVAQSLVGFKHDEEPAHVSGGQFSVLSRTAPRRDILARFLKR